MMTKHEKGREEFLKSFLHSLHDCRTFTVTRQVESNATRQRDTNHVTGYELQSQASYTDGTRTYHTRLIKEYTVSERDMY